MAKKKSIRIKVNQGPFGLTAEIIGGSKESRKKASDIIIYMSLFEGPFGSARCHTAEEWEDAFNDALEERGYLTEV